MNRVSTAMGTLGLLFSPAFAAACPRCFLATPYHGGLLFSVFVLLPVPFILVGLLVFFLKRSVGDPSPSRNRKA